MSKELWTVVIDAAATVAVGAVGLWIVPEYRDFALTVIGAFQVIAAAFVLEFRTERKIAALRADVRMLKRR